MIQPADSTLMAEFNPPVTSHTDHASVSPDGFQSALSAAHHATTALSSNPRLAADGLIQTRRLAGASSSPAESETDTSTAASSEPVQTATENPMPSLPVPPASATPVMASAAPATTPSAPALDPQQIFDNEYWASQPPAVQALRTMDPSERTTMAAQLAGEGYQIDVPIMVWGWDPSITMSMRKAEGYTWVPSALQNPVEDLPGLPSMGGLTAYNSSDPPAGSIAV